MKRLVVAFLIAIMFTQPVRFWAVEKQEDVETEYLKTEAEILSLALEYFPEYSERITNPVQISDLLMVASEEEDDLVVNETQAISEDEQIVYQEYASGRANILFIVKEYNDLTQTGVNYTYNCVDIQVYSLLLSKSMYIDDFEYTIYKNKYDVIQNYGITSMSALSINVSHKKNKETASGPATATYSAVFEYHDGSFFAGQVVPCSLLIEVGGDEFKAKAY